MKQIALLTIIAGLSAISMAAIYASDFGQLQLAVATPNDDRIGMFGHIEFEHLDSFDNIIGYYQTDNFITEMGASCAATLIFGGSAISPCISTPTDFLYIGVGNVTNDDTVTVVELNGELEERKIDGNGASISSTAGFSEAVAIIKTESPFQFGPGNSTDPIFQAGLFDQATDGNVFSIQNTTSSNPNPGITVNDGDQLTVTWEITVG